MDLYFDMQPLPEHVLDLEPGLALWFRFNEHGNVGGWITRPDVFPFDEEDESVSDLWVKHHWTGDDWEPRYNLAPVSYTDIQVIRHLKDKEPEKEKADAREKAAEKADAKEKDAPKAKDVPD